MAIAKNGAATQAALKTAKATKPAKVALEGTAADLMEVPGKPVSLIELTKQTIKVRVRGISPLIVHAWSTKAIRQMEEKQQRKAAKAKEAKDPEVEFQGCLYLDDQGRHCFPARAFKAAMVAATTSIEDKKFPKTKIRQVVFVEGDLLPIISKTEPDMRTDPVRLGGTTADIRYRPEYKDWYIDLTLTFNAAAVSSEQLINLLNLAGFAVGVGEWRPEKNGSNGRFEVVRPG
jgi:hypothetical protein